MAAEERDLHPNPLSGVHTLRPGTYPQAPLDAGASSGVAATDVPATHEALGDRQDLIDVLQDLVACCKDGEYGFKSCADHAQRENLRAVLMQCALDCARGAQDLNDQIQSLSGDVRDSGSALGAVHRGWVSMKLTLSSQDDKVVLGEAERGEADALTRYREALQKPLPAAIRSLVERQLQAVQRHHDQIKMLRNQLSIPS